MRTPIVQHMVMVHNNVRSNSELFEAQLKRYNYVTPKNYLDFISNYRGVLEDERRKIDSLIQRLDGGLSKLVQAATEVDAMSKKLEVAQVEVDKKSAEVKVMLVEIQDATAKAEARQKEAQEKEALARDRVGQDRRRQGRGGGRARGGAPALEEAAQALNDLKKDDITELRSFEDRTSSCRTSASASASSRASRTSRGRAPRR